MVKFLKMWAIIFGKWVKAEELNETMKFKLMYLMPLGKYTALAVVRKRQLHED